MTVLVGAMSIVLALMWAGASAPKLFKIMVTVFGCAVGPLGLPMLVGIVSKRVNALSTVIALLGGLALRWYTIPQPGQLRRRARRVTSSSAVPKRQRGVLAPPAARHRPGAGSSVEAFP